MERDALNHEAILAVLPESKDEAKSLKEIAQDMELEMASYVDPPLTTVFQPVREKAAMAVRYLVNALDPDAGEPEQVVLPVRWVPGGTLGRAVAPTEENRNEDQ